ncbi:MAG: hypothetical protein EPO02_13845 [Nitrospirae bacterium]|nr:MAG: hypothetical protein EPO02_13845 [Nitrospirota bacterium]
MTVELDAGLYGSYADADFGPALNTAISAAGPGVVIVTTQAFTFSTQVVNPDLKPVVMGPAGTWTGSGTDAIVVGRFDGSSHTPTTDIRHVYNIERSPTTTDAYSGVKFGDVSWGKFDLRLYGFYYGFTEAPTLSAYYNDFDIIALNCIVSQRIYLRGTGSCNSNLYKFLKCGSVQAIAGTVAGVLIDNTSSNGSVNGSTWLAPTFEVYNSVGSWACFWGQSGALASTQVMNECKVIGGRVEPGGGNNPYIVGGAGIIGNSFDFAFGWRAAESHSYINASSASAFVWLVQNHFAFADMHPDGGTSLTEIASLERSNVVSRSTGTIQRPARGIIRAGAAQTWLNEYAGGSLASTHISWSATDRAIGVLLDVSQCEDDIGRKIFVELLMSSGTQGGLIVIPFNSSGTMQLGSGDCSLTSVASTWFTTSSSLSQINSVFSIGFGGSANIVYLFVGVAGGASPMLLRQMKIRAMPLSCFKLVSDPAIYVTTGGAGAWSFVDTGDPISLGTPDTDTSQVGRFVRHTTPVAGSPSGWFINGSGVALPMANL